MTRQEAFIRWNTEMEAWIQYLKKKEELIRLQEEGEAQIGDLEKTRRQIQAIYNLRSGVFVNPELILAFVHPESIAKGNIAPLKYTTDKLDESQKTAVDKALSGQCFTLIQGPPGTGKTSVITEICSQILLRDSSARILVCSETHVAVNNIFYNLDRKFENFMGLRIKDKEFDDEKTREKFQINQVLITYLERLQRKGIPEGIVQLLKGEIETNSSRINEMLFYSSRFVGITCNGIGGISFNAKYPFDYVILDENSKISFPEIILALIWGKKAVMVGDPVQLAPVYTELDRQAMTETGTGSLESCTYIEEVYARIPEHAFTMLNRQYRMVDEISAIISKYFYQGKLLNGIEHNSLPGSVVWADYLTECLWPISNLANIKRSPYNLDELEVIKDILKKEAGMLNHTGRKKQISIIAPYKGQKSKLIHMVNRNQEVIELKRNINIKIDTVDSIQGRDSEVVIFSITRNHGTSFFFSNYKRLNVAFSRAKRKLWIVGQRSYTDKVYHWVGDKKVYMLKEIADSCVNEFFSLRELRNKKRGV